MSLISVIIPTWNNAEYTIGCLKQLEANTAADVHVVWIDNGSDDREHEAVAAFVRSFQHHDLERHAEPLGFAGASNRGLKHVRGDYTVFLNNDVEVLPGWDEELRNTVDAIPGMAGPLAVGADAGWQSTKVHAWLGIPEECTIPHQVAAYLKQAWSGQAIDLPAVPHLPVFRGMLAFFCALLPTRIMREIGPLDEQFGWGYCEDDDYCARLRQAGYTISLCPGAVVRHAVGRTMAAVPGDFQTRLNENMARFERKWGRTIDGRSVTED
jgi:GT2 family glycosyltransferase